MKNLYAMLIACAAIVLAGSATAQWNMPHPTKGGATVLKVQNPFAHPTSGELRGGGAPPNDLCSSVTPNALAVPGSLDFTGDNTGATSTDDFVSGSPLEQTGDTSTVWHAFTTDVCADVTVEYCGTATLPYSYWVVLTTACPVDDEYILFSSLANCADTNLIMNYTALPAGTYYVPVYGAPGTTGPYTILVSAAACAAAPANDDCEGAITLTPASTCSFTDFNSEGATEFQPADSCSGYLGDANDDIWFSFVATVTDMTVAAQGAGDEDTGYDPVVQVFEGACGGLTALGCEDSTLNAGIETVDLTGLVVGNTYFVRVFHFYTGTPGDFNVGLCVVENGPIGFDELGEEEFALFPNPGTGMFNLQYAGKSGLGNLEVFDVAGRVVYNAQTQLARGSTHSLDLTVLSPGNYNVRLTVGGVRTEQRLMVK